MKSLLLNQINKGRIKYSITFNCDRIVNLLYFDISVTVDEQVTPKDLGRQSRRNRLQDHSHRQKVRLKLVRLGVETVAIYSDIDRHSKFVEMADKAYRVGGNLSCKLDDIQPNPTSTKERF